MKQPMKVPEQPKENFDRPTDVAPKTDIQPPRTDAPREREVIEARANVIDATRKSLADLARKLPKSEGTRQERFAA
ncbi:MAG: hypothetical protein Q7S29_01205 [Candidatus Peribacter sp.]|nr:hypothetical protein [Candidatus Peribacter sp.]